MHELHYFADPVNQFYDNKKILVPRMNNMIINECFVYYFLLKF